MLKMSLIYRSKMGNKKNHEINVSSNKKKTKLTVTIGEKNGETYPIETKLKGLTIDNTNLRDVLDYLHTTTRDSEIKLGSIGHQFFEELFNIIVLNDAHTKLDKERMIEKELKELIERIHPEIKKE